MEQIFIEDLISELSSIHKQLNMILFNGQLKQVKIAIENSRRQNRASTLGTFNGNDNWIDGTKMQITIYTLALRGVPEEIIETLIHEMVHQYNFQLGVKDSENNQRHNKKFKEVAVSLGKLIVTRDEGGHRGYAHTALSKELKDIIDNELVFNRDVLSIRHKHALYREISGYNQRKTYTCNCEGLTIVNSREKNLNIICLDCRTKFKKTCSYNKKRKENI